MSKVHVELVGGPRDGERRVIDRPAGYVRFKVAVPGRSRRVEVMYRRRAAFRRGSSVVDVILYDYVPETPA